MSVYDARYRKIEENSVKPPSTKDAALTMSVFEIRRGLSGTWPKVPLVLAGFIVFGFLVSLTSFLGADPKVFWLGQSQASDITTQQQQPNQGPPISVLANISFMLVPIDGPGAIILIHIAVISAGLIAGDLKDRAIDLYYSKISLNAYFISKLVASIVLTFIGMPLFTLIYFIIALYKRWPDINLMDWLQGNFGEYELAFEVFWKMMAFMALELIFLSVIILVFSAFTTNSVNSGIMFIVFTFVTRVFFEVILYQATNIDLFYVLSPLTALNILRLQLFGPNELTGQFLNAAIFSYMLYVIGGLALIYFKLRREQQQ